MYRVPGGIAFHDTFDLTIFDGKNYREVPCPGERGHTLSVNRAVLYYFLNRGTHIYRLDGDEWIFVRTISGDISVKSGLFVLRKYGADWAETSPDGIRWTRGPFVGSDEEEDLTWPTERLYTDNETTVLADDNGLVINGERWAGAFLDGVFKWQGQLIGYDDTYFYFLKDRTKQRHNLGEILEVASNDYVLVLRRYDEFPVWTRDLTKWTAILTPSSSLTSVSNYIVSRLYEKITIFFTPKWTFQAMIDALPFYRKKIRSVMLSLRRDFLGFLRIMEYV